MKVQEVKEKTASATKWSAITELVAKFIAPITNMVLARLLTPEAFGVVATVTMVVSFADMFTDAGFQKYLMQHDFESRNELDQHTSVAFWTNIGISLTLWCIISIFSNQISAMVGNPGLGNVIIIASLSLPLTSFSSIQMARFKRDFDFKSLLFIRIVSSLIPFLVTIPIALITRSYWALVIGTLVGNAANAIILTWKSTWKPQFYYSVSVLKEMFSYSWWILLETVSIWLTTYIDIFIVGRFLTQYYVGIYKTSMTTVNQFMGLITSATSVPLFVALSRLKNDRENLIETYNNYIQAISIFVIPLGMGMWLYRGLLVDILLGPQWGEATEFVGLWALMYAISIVLGTYCNGLYNAIGKTYLSFASQILQLVVLVPVLLWSVRIDFQHLYVSRSLIRLELVVAQMIIMRVILHFPIMKQFAKILPSIVCTAIMAMVSLLLQRVGDSTVWQFVSIFICIVTYFAAMLIIYKDMLFRALETLGIRKSR